MNKKYSVKFVVNQSSLDLLCDPLFFMKRYCDSQLQCVHLGSVHKYFGAGAGQNGGGVKKVLSYQKGGDQKVFLSKGGGVKKVWSNWKYNENQNAQFVAKINRI